jgi:DNA-binding transcriptional ArsR family regulator
MTATALAREYEISRQAVTKHLAVLCDAGVLAADRVANEVRYRIVTAPLFAAAAWLAGLGAAWDGRQTAPPRRRTAAVRRPNRASRT